jgi:hypothetical protein
MNDQPKSPLDYLDLEFHELADDYPLIEGDELANLVEDIRKKGILDPITLHPNGKILDGRNRYRAALEAGVALTASNFRYLPQGWDPEEFVSSKNDHRRNLDNKAKRALIEKKINRHPYMSERKLAKLACCDHKTVASVKADMKKRVDTLTEGWKVLSDNQRRDFLDRIGGEILKLLGISPAQI